MRTCLTSECLLNTTLTPSHSNLITFSFSHVFWIDASSVSTIAQALKGICNLPEARSSALDGSPESALRWIGLLKENYAMVFDNADDISPAELEAYLPPGRMGNILITILMKDLDAIKEAKVANDIQNIDVSCDPVIWRRNVIFKHLPLFLACMVLCSLLVRRQWRHQKKKPNAR